jgi:hypothetical protein
MKRLATLLAFTSVLAACGGTADNSDEPRAQGSVGQGSVFPARVAGAGAVGSYDAALGPRFQRPGGIEAADGRSYYAPGSGKLVRYDPLTETVERTYPLRGAWRLAGVSANGDWVALQNTADRIRVLEARTGRIAYDVVLRGDFRVETVSAAGDFLFLLQDFVDGSYAVRGYDLAGGQLLPGSLGTKGEVVQMQGLASQVVGSPDGRWLLTLYVNTQTETAFVHALNLIERFAVCINLPPCTNCSRETLKDWALALAPDGRTLFAANPALGNVATVYLPAARLIAENRFVPSRGGATRAGVSKDGLVLFTNGRTTWSFDPSANTIERVVERAA